MQHFKQKAPNFILYPQLSFKDDDNGPRTNLFEKYFIPLKEMKY